MQQINLKMTRNAFLKAKKYTVKINGKDQREITYHNYTTVFEVKAGKYTLEVANTTETKEEVIQVAEGQSVQLVINPAITYNMVLTFLVILALTVIFAQVLIMNKPSIPLLFIPVVPIILLRRRQFPDKFLLTVKTSGKN